MRKHTKPLECGSTGEEMMWWVNYWAYRIAQAVDPKGLHGFAVSQLNESSGEGFTATVIGRLNKRILNHRPDFSEWLAKG